MVNSELILMSSAETAIALEGALSLGRYELVRRLAIGGMAELYLARVTGIDGFSKLLVLKRILPHLARESDFIRMFVREARIAATLHHANIVQVFDIGKVDETYFFTMEYVLGIDVRRLLLDAVEAKTPVPLEHAISIIIAVAAGLHYAHEQRGDDGKELGIVHRDVSPSNILVGFDGVTKILDFGIATITRDRNATRPGSIKGKVSYMSPEQAGGEDLDRRADVFAIGILLYELTTNSYLFSGPSDLDVMRNVVEGRIKPPSFRVPGYPPELERIVMRALERNREARYPTAAQLQIELEQFAFSQRLEMSPRRLAEYVKAFAQPGAEELARGDHSVVIERTLGASPNHADDQVHQWVSRTSTAYGEPPALRRRKRWARRLWIVSAVLVAVSLAVLVARRWNDPAERPPEQTPTAAPAATAPPPTPPPPTPPPPTPPDDERRSRERRPLRDSKPASRRSEPKSGGSAKAPDLVDPF